MSLFSTMRTSVSGMAAQSNALSTIGDNIANSSTTGYKSANAQFETVLGQNSTGEYESGGVQTDIRYGITTQGTLTTTTSATDIAVNGNGFFVVSKNGEGQYMTRAGSFVPDSNGNLVNAAGFQLMGYPIGADGTVGSTLQTVNVASSNLQWAASTTATLAANVSSQAAVVTPQAASAGPPAVAAVTYPSSNTAGFTYTSKTSITSYDTLGTPVTLDVYLTNEGNNKWDVAVFNKADAAANGSGPYSGSGLLGSGTLTFDSTSGELKSGGPINIKMPSDLATPSSGNVVSMDVSQMTQLATDFGVTTATANGNSPSKLASVSIGKDGTLTDVYSSGVQVAAYEIPLATVASPNNLTPLSGNVYQVSNDSGSMILNKAGTNGAGAIDSDTLEQSTVDLASELTNMIVAQRAYEANSKVLQAGSDLLGVLNRLSTN